jgi:Cd2+/Zn2+-exporting ATPase
MSTPVAVVSAMACAASMGVLIKGGVHLETLGRLRSVAFDKTGTLTMGRFEVTQSRIQPGFEEADVHRLVHTAETGSSHPLAAALLKHVEGVEGAPSSSQETLEGMGLAVRANGRTIHIGNRVMAQDQGWVSEETEALYQAWKDRGQTVVYIGVDGRLAGIYALADTLRSEAKDAITDLKALGLESTMLTGDNRGVAQNVQQLVGLDTFEAELLPWDKVEAVEKMKKTRGPTAMVGDGINDSPALAAADVGIAMGVRGTAAALETADVALMTDDLRRLSEVVLLGRRTLKVIRHNITFSLVVKAVVLILAAVGIANLWMAVAADVGATLAVVLYGLTLLRRPARDTAPSA